MPVHTLQLDISVVDLEGEFQGLAKVDVGSLNGVDVFTSGLELVELEVFGEHFHFINYKLGGMGKASHST